MNKRIYVFSLQLSTKPNHQERAILNYNMFVETVQIRVGILAAYKHFSELIHPFVINIKSYFININHLDQMGLFVCHLPHLAHHASIDFTGSHSLLLCPFSIIYISAKWG